MWLPALLYNRGIVIAPSTMILWPVKQVKPSFK
jgi:hypothetical protein